MKEIDKKFDAVAMMRSARDRISEKIEGMTLEEELRWLAAQEIQDPFLRGLQDRVTRESNASSELAVGR